MEVEIAAACEGTALIFEMLVKNGPFSKCNSVSFGARTTWVGPLCGGDPFLCMPTHSSGRKKVNSSNCDYEQGKQSSYLTYESTIQNKSSKKGC